MAAELVYAARTDGITVDEPVYISAGYRHLTALDFRLNPETPPLAKMLAALPLLPLDLHTPLAPGEWGFIDRFFHENSATRIISWARVPAIVMSLLLAALVWGWGRVVGVPAMARAPDDPARGGGRGRARRGGPDAPHGLAPGPELRAPRAARA